jgi:hypothetical protein
MIDMLVMRSEKAIDLRKLETIFSKHQISRKPDKIFKNCFIITSPEQHLLTIKSLPVWDNVFLSQIIINPTKWETMKDMELVLAQLCDLKELEIIRIDHAVDLPLPLEDIYAGLRIKFKQDSQLYKEMEAYKRGVLTGFYLGNKPEIYCVYDKGYQLDGSKLKRISDINIGQKTRIELRQFNKKIQFPRLIDIQNYVSHPPFNNVEYYKVISETHDSLGLDSLLFSKGMGQAYFQLNQHGNFKRNTSELLRKIPLSQIMNAIYSQRISQFFEIAEQSSANILQEAFKSKGINI